MSTIAILVHGLSRPDGVKRESYAQRLGPQLRVAGFPVDAVQVWTWDSGSIGWGILAWTGASLLLGGAIGLGVRGLSLLGAAGAGVGAANAYAGARREIPGASQALALRLAEIIDAGHQVHLVGHSLGSEVVLGALAYLGQWGLRLPGIAILTAGTADAAFDYSRPAAAAAHGVINILNPWDPVLLAELSVRLDAVVGRKGMVGRGVENVATTLGHTAQLWNLAAVLRPEQGIAPGTLFLEP